MNTLPSELKARLENGSLQKSELADGSGVVIDIGGRKVLSLNATGMILLQQLLEQQSTDSLHLALTDKFELPEAQAQADTDEFLKNLEQALKEHK